MRTHGRPGGLIRLDTEDGARWSYTDSESGFVVILKHAADYRELGGTVDAARTKAANAKTAVTSEEPAPVDPAAGLDTEAAGIASDMARRAVAAAMQEEDGTARRTYTTDSGLLMVRACFDGDSVAVAWQVDGRPLSRAAAESLITERMGRLVAQSAAARGRT